MNEEQPERPPYPNLMRVDVAPLHRFAFLPVPAPLDHPSARELGQARADQRRSPLLPHLTFGASPCRWSVGSPRAARPYGESLLGPAWFLRLVWVLPLLACGYSAGRPQTRVVRGSENTPTDLPTDNHRPTDRTCQPTNHQTSPLCLATVDSGGGSCRP